jgi:hypothetical protein
LSRWPNLTSCYRFATPEQPTPNESEEPMVITQVLAGPTGLGTSAARLFRRAPGADVSSDTTENEPDRPAGSDAKRLSISRFTFPWASAMHPEADSIELGARAFAERFGLVPHEAYRARLARARYGRLAARCYPTADRELVQILADYMIWYFPVDDLFVDRVHTLSPRTLLNLTAMIDVLDHHRVGAEPVWGEYAWLDICTRLRGRLSDEHFQRFAHGMRMWASTAGLQILNHLQDTSVDIPHYEAIRRHTSGMNPCLDVADAAELGPLTPAEFNQPAVQKLRMQANNVVCWSNDVQSVQIEMAQPGQYWNMVSIYASQGLTLQQAVDLVAARVNAEITAFQLLARTVEPAASPQLRGFIDGMRHWMHGYQDWVDYDTQRYSDEFIAQDADDTAVQLETPTPVGQRSGGRESGTFWERSY